LTTALAVSNAPDALGALGGAEVTMAGSLWQRSSAGSSAWVENCKIR
jgi:hypothetical protein